MANCALCVNQLSSSSFDQHYDSAEHIFPNSVGGFKTVSGFICRKCNSETGETWDAALAKTMLPLCHLFNIVRDRGGVPSLKITTTEGERVTLKGEGGIDFTNPLLVKTQRPDGLLDYKIEARSLIELRKILEGIKKKLPSLDVDAQLASAQEIKGYLDGDFEFTFDFGGPEGGRSMVKTCLAFAFSIGVDWHKCENATTYLREQSTTSCFGYYYGEDLVKNRKPSTPFHCVAVLADPATGLILSYAEYFGCVRIVALLGTKYAGPRLESAYAIDPRNGEEFRVKVQIDFDLERINNVIVGQYRDGEAFKAAFSGVIGPTIESQKAAERTRVVDNAVDKAFDECGAMEGEELTAEHLRRLTLSIAESVIPYLKHTKRSVNGPKNS